MDKNIPLILTRLLSLVVITAIVYVLAVMIPHDNPVILSAVGSLLGSISWFLGKIFERPLDSVTVANAGQLPPEAAAQVIAKIASNPPPQLKQIMASMPPLAGNRVILEFRDTEPAPSFDERDETTRNEKLHS